ncbi:MAG: glycogen synthase GlgA [Candidatus Izimaplasma sp.]|nr:glycogen synthase GlgA [Candidatus Izimaplasma bacterium]
MKILFVGSEATPFSKTGGLADVLGALPKELVNLGNDVRVVLPKHGVTKEKFNSQMHPLCKYRVTVGDKEEYCGIESIERDGVIYYFIDNEYYFGYRDTLYGHYDDGERYGFFNNAVMQMFEHLNYYPDIIHVNDWTAGLIPFIFNKNYKHLEKYKHMKTLFTIHNIAYQGVFSKHLLKYLNVEFGDELEFNNNINFLKCGINSADYVTTVSDTYSKEILYDYYGFGMSEILKSREDTLFGIINGVDYENFNPKIDPNIVHNYSPYNYLKGKKENKEALREFFNLERNDLPIISMVTRLTEAKGFELIKEIIEEYVSTNKFQFVLLGSGDAQIEEFYNYLKERYSNNVGVYIGYSEPLARKIYAGTDMFLMPSRFEPCGLAQLISLKYGSLPIVRKTGGLKDSIDSYNQFTNEGTGFSFENYDSVDLADAIDTALEVYSNKPVWKTLVRRVMEKDFSWEQSAKKYLELYKKLKGE